MGRVALRLAALLALAVIAAALILVTVARRRLDRRYEVAAPAIARATSPEALARGQRLYRGACASCHTPPGQTRSCGAPVGNFPAAFGSIYASDLTSDGRPDHGLGRRSDADLARLLRHGVLPDGRYSRTMPRMARLGDQDIAALIGYLRSGDPRFTPCPQSPPPGHLSLLGQVALAFFSPAPPEGDGAASSIPVPPRGPNASYGRYLATAIYGCVECHTDGLTNLDTKLASLNLLAGGMELPDPRGDPIPSTNLTPDATGIGGWTLAGFQRALSTGISPDGLAVRPPMPIFRTADPTELEAIFSYLRSLPAVKRQGRTLPPTGPRPTAATAPAELFVRLGCAPCHGTGAPFRGLIVRAVARATGPTGGTGGTSDVSAATAARLARAIRSPEAANPDTQMPSYAAVLDEAQALSLAGWLMEGDAYSPASRSMFR